jgi:hypothetical protein
MPFVGIASGMKYAVDDHRALYILVKDRVWKATHQPPSIILVDNGIHLGRTTDSCNTSLDTAQKLFAQATPPTLVPSVRSGEVLLGLWRKD